MPCGLTGLESEQRDAAPAAIWTAMTPNIPDCAISQQSVAL